MLQGLPALYDFIVKTTMLRITQFALIIWDGERQTILRYHCAYDIHSSGTSRAC
jgi:hypothetical protein